MEALLPLLIFLIVFALNASNKKKSRQEAKQRYAAKMAKAQKPAAPKAVREKPPVAAVPQEQLTDFGQRDRDGSIDMPPMEPHEHEGKPMPCPAEERELPRPRPAAQAAVQPPARPAALQLNFSRNSVVQGVVMAEVLRRPQYEHGRRVIR